jgi:signal transduction histidine kinase/ActR/RegA family two-component response regulator
MDVSMPELDGFELAEIIRQHPRCRQTAIIFVSAVHLSDIDRIKAYETGAVDYVSVPVIPELLRAKVTVFTELYRNRRDAERLNQELETRVAERTAELEQAVARQTALTQMLREADRRKDEFLALLAHELRNPLAPLANAIDIMKRKGVPDDPDLGWCRRVMERQVRQLTRLIDDLLDVSRITLGKIRLRTQVVEIRDVVTAAIDACQPLIDGHAHSLSCSVSDEPLVVRGDPARLVQVVANLLNNSTRYQPRGGAITVRAVREKGHAVVSVSDAGIGIAPDMLSRIFELFVQGNQESEHAPEGLGVGLSLVKTVVELHGGSITAHSDGPGKGSEFSLRLPLAAAAQPADGAEPAGPAGGGGQAILIVDDNVDAAEGLATLLRMSGYTVALAHEGRGALEIAARFRPRVFLVDIGLPGMDGYELCRRLRAAGGTDALMIAVTGYGQERDRELALAAGFDAHAVKPVEFDFLLGLIERRSQRAGRQAAGPDEAEAGRSSRPGR